jgi:hypothetical protein
VELSGDIAAQYEDQKVSLLISSETGGKALQNSGRGLRFKVWPFGS